MEGFLHYDFGGLIFGGTHTWRGLFSEFYCIFGRRLNKTCKASILFLSMHTMYTSCYQHCNIRQ